jgi:hypothetical protein
MTAATAAMIRVRIGHPLSSRGPLAKCVLTAPRHAPKPHEFDPYCRFLGESKEPDSGPMHYRIKSQQENQV